MAKPKRTKLTDKQLQCISLLIMKDFTNQNNQQIAEEVGVSPKTIYQWYKEDIFVDELNRQTEAIQRAWLNEAYHQLRKIMVNGTEKNQLKAIEIFLKNQGRLIEKQEVSHEVKSDSIADLAKKYNINIE